MNKRDTQFAGFAEKLYQEIQEMACSYRTAPSPEELKQRECEIIARRAFDLVLHTVWNVAPIDLERLFMHEVAAKVPDMATWPEEQ